jgi:hypothetical protein
MARFYANENFPRQVVEELRKLGHDVLTVQETGKASIAWPDPDVFAFAMAENRLVLTMNRRHFRKLHQNEPNHPGMVLCTVDLDYLGQAARIDKAVRGAGDCHGQLINVYRPNTRA